MKVIKLIRYNHPPFVKHVLAPQNEFGIQKNSWSIYKSFGNWEDPPPHVWKNSQIMSYFFSESVPYARVFFGDESYPWPKVVWWHQNQEQMDHSENLDKDHSQRKDDKGGECSSSYGQVWEYWGLQHKPQLTRDCTGTRGRVKTKHQNCTTALVGGPLEEVVFTDQ